MVTCGSSADNSGSSNGALDDWNERSEFRLEDTVEIVWSTGCDKAVAVCEFGEDSDVVWIFVLDSVCHYILLLLYQLSDLHFNVIKLVNNDTIKIV